MAKNAKARGRAAPEPSAITEIQVAGFKSISEEQKIEIRPLTILAGANSSGKSSMMQPLLLLKQTLESPYAPAGPILLNGPIMKFTLAEQLLSRIGKGQSLDTFQVGMHLNTGDGFVTGFRKEHKMGFRIEQMEVAGTSGTFALWPEMTRTQIIETGITKAMIASEIVPEERGGKLKIGHARCFLTLEWGVKSSGGLHVLPAEILSAEHLGAVWERIIPETIHLPGLRGNPERTYPVTAVGPNYPGTFEKYTASVISQWMEEGSGNLAKLNADLRSLKLTGGVTVFRPNEVQIELHVGRLPDVSPERPENRVNIADVGVGVSQVVPVLVALHAAKPGQLVYVEQPETHLHPRAQVAMGSILANAADRGVRVVVETHSPLLVLAVQALVAEGKLAPSRLKLHWFKRQPAGHTVVSSTDVDEAGAFGEEWPEDFDDVTLDVQKRYLDAAEKHLFAQ